MRNTVLELTFALPEVSSVDLVSDYLPQVDNVRMSQLPQDFHLSNCCDGKPLFLFLVICSDHFQRYKVTTCCVPSLVHLLLWKQDIIIQHV